MRRLLSVSKAIFCLFLLAFSSPILSETGYFIGNSLTQGVKVYGLRLMADTQGISFATGMHRVGGASLDYIWTHPEEHLQWQWDFGGFTNALPSNQWSFVVLQPYLDKLGEGSIALDTARLIDLIDLTLAGGNQDTKFFLFTSYPRISSGDYRAAWSQSIDPASNIQTTHARQYYEILRDNVIDHYGLGFPIYIIPIGEVLFELEGLIQAGRFPAYTGVFADFYTCYYYCL